MRARLSPVVVVGATLLAATVVWAQARVTSSKERRFFSARDGVGLEAPNGWALSTHTGYPTVLVVFVHPGGSRISMAVDRTKLATAAALAEQNRPGLLGQGFVIDRVAPGPVGGVRVEAHAPRRNQVIRQLYLVRGLDGVRDGHQAIIVSLAGPTDQLTAVGPAFDWTVGHLALEAPARIDDKPDAGR
jgi:hypothetical protein